MGFFQVSKIVTSLLSPNDHRFRFGSDYLAREHSPDIHFDSINKKCYSINKVTNMVNRPLVNPKDSQGSFCVYQNLISFNCCHLAAFMPAFLILCFATHRLSPGPVSGIRQ